MGGRGNERSEGSEGKRGDIADEILAMDLWAIRLGSRGVSLASEEGTGILDEGEAERVEV
jgi:hypothetical protein